MALRLFMVMAGCYPPGRHTEQHDIFFGIAESVKDLIPQLQKFWPDAGAKLHIDAYREVTRVDNFSVRVLLRGKGPQASDKKLFFINLGGYQSGLFDERHFKIVTVQPDKASAIAFAKNSEFFKKIHFEKAHSHIDDKFGVDIDDLYDIAEVLAPEMKEKYQLVITPAATGEEDEISIGYFPLSKF